MSGILFRQLGTGTHFASSLFPDTNLRDCRKSRYPRDITLTIERYAPEIPDFGKSAITKIVPNSKLHRRITDKT